ncbi:MAG: hypothetical protein PHF30_04610 [Bacilli bacterium]|nr:hypothetical protein [Bacilli bacterium]
MVAKYGFYNEEEDAFISIADIIGYQKNIMQSSNIFLSISFFFESNADEYHSRSIDLLNYNANDLLKVLKNSFLIDPMAVKEMPNKKYIIVTNGFHRYTLLRAHFVNESYNMDITSDEYLKLKKKYEIPIKTHRLDLTKTYCKLLLLNNPNFKGKIKPEFDNNYQTTGNIILELTNDKKIVVSDDKLIEIIRLFIKNTICEEYFDLILYYYNNFKDFKIFININFPELNFESKNNFKNIL